MGLFWFGRQHKAHYFNLFSYHAYSLEQEEGLQGLTGNTSNTGFGVSWAREFDGAKILETEQGALQACHKLSRIIT